MADAKISQLTPITGATMQDSDLFVVARPVSNGNFSLTRTQMFLDVPAASVDGGTASAPAVSFSTDTDTGVYSAGPNSFGITTGGTEAATFEDAGQTVFQLLSSDGDQLLNVDETTDDLLQVINSDDTVLFQVSNTTGLMIGPSRTIATSTSTGITGQIAWDAEYIYICIATNTWKRVEISTW